MDRINSDFCLFRRSELMNSVAEIKNMTMGIPGIFK